MADNKSWTERYQASLYGVFGTPKTVFTTGKGAEIWDADGRRYLDLLGGIAVNSLGHAHPAMQAYFKQISQGQELLHVSNFFTTPNQIAAAEAILDKVCVNGRPAAGRVFFANSGGEANEAALKLVRRHANADQAHPRPRILAMNHCFHGRTTGALALTYKEAYRSPFAPLMPGVEFIEPTAEALTAAMGPDVAGVFIEPVQGEAGVITMPPGFLAHARQLCTEHGALLVLDEIQSGLGRCGAWMAHHLQPGPDGQPIVPDVLTLAKGLGGGVPVGACVALNEYTAGLLTPGQHGTTFGGNPLATGAVSVVLRTLEQDSLVTYSLEQGRRWRESLRSAHAEIKEVRGSGLLIGVEFATPVAAAVGDALLSRGYVVSVCNPSTIRLAPALVITPEQMAEFTAVLAEVIDQVLVAN